MNRGAGFAVLWEPISPLLTVPGARHGRKRCPNWFCSRPDSPRLVGRCRGFPSPFPVTAAEMLVFSGKVAVKPERTPGSLWVKAALWFCGKLLPPGCPLLPGCCLELPGRGKLTLQVLGNHLLSSPAVLVCVGQIAELLGLSCLWQNTELSFPSYLPGCFAGGSNLLSQGGRGMGAPRGAFHVGWEGEIPYDRSCTAKEKDPTAFLSHFFSLPA